MEKAQPFFYFKPLLIRNGSVEWSRGENYPAIATSGAPLEIHPYFLDDGHRSVCELMRPLASPAGMEHRFRVFLPLGNPENTLKRYPVLYMHDGNNLFLKEEAFLGNTWKTDEVLGMLDKMSGWRRNRNGSSRSISTAAGRATITRRPAACAIASSGKDIDRAPTCSILRFPTRATTRIPGRSVVQSRSSFCLATSLTFSQVTGHWEIRAKKMPR